MEFTPKQKYTLLSKMGYTGSEDQDSMEQFIASQPGVASKMGKFQRALTRGFERGGGVGWNLSNPVNYTPPTPTAPTTEAEEPEQPPVSTTPTGDISAYTPTLTTLRERAEITPEMIEASKGTVSEAEKAFLEQQQLVSKYPAGHPQLPALEAELQKRQTALDEAKSSYETLLNPLDPYKKEMAASAVVNPANILKEQDVAKMTAAPGTVVDPNTGQLQGDATGQATTAGASRAADIQGYDAGQYDASLVDDKVQQAMQDTPGAATSEVGREATVKGQFEDLMKDFESGTPPWASGAMREASARMQARGMGASSMAGMAIVQSAMEAALPIAQADAATYAQREMANLSNEQQTRILKTQFRFEGLFRDQAADNAAKNFNATSENQTNEFLTGLRNNVAQFNSAQINAMRQFNAGETNAMEEFNVKTKDLREQFNAKNSAIIAQANAVWRQSIETTNTAAQNEANRQFAANYNALSAAALDNYWQEERDKMAFAFQETENEKDRNTEILLGQMGINAQAASDRANRKYQTQAAIGGLASKILFGGSGGGGLLGGVLGF